MKRYDITNRVSSQARLALEKIIAAHETYSHAYFFHTGASASQRRANERNFDKTHPDVIFIKRNDKILVSMTYYETCKRVYYKCFIYKNNEKKNISFVKSLLK